ncbi:CRAL-TRIO domain-containing protein [Geopyxis carbonaria]|nr:CRAL-TRIO domain-containing protein [Geopyxis carbonaria]
MSSEQISAPETWPEFKADHPLIALFHKVPEVLEASEGYSEIWGIKLTAPKNPAPFSTALILQKFLRANKNKVADAFNQLKETMEWRKSFFSPGGEAEKGWSDAKFAGLGYTTKIKTKSDPTHETVIAWNIYGGVKDMKATFGNTDEFIRWRVALMEASIKMLELEKATKPIPDYNQGEDPYQTIQVHDYLSISFLRLPSEVKNASNKTIKLFGRYYPETLSQKYFVNVPMIMGWVYSFMKKIVAMETMKKLEMLGSGSDLAKALGEEIPEVYGGKGTSLETMGQTVSSPRDVDAEIAEEAAVAEEKKASEEAAAKEAKEAKEEESKKEAEPVKEEETVTKDTEAAPITTADVKPAAIEPLPLTEPKTEAAVADKTAEPVSTTIPEETSTKTEETAAATEDEKPKEMAILPVVPETK